MDQHGQTMGGNLPINCDTKSVINAAQALPLSIWSIIRHLRGPHAEEVHLMPEVPSKIMNVGSWVIRERPHQNTASELPPFRRKHIDLWTEGTYIVLPTCTSKENQMQAYDPHPVYPRSRMVRHI